MKKVSVVVPCYNAAPYLDKCIQHLLHQTIGLENMEIILVNDASIDNDATLNILLKYEKKYPDSILVVSLEENMRQGGARNVGIFYASGEYLIFCDTDDWLMAEALEHSYNAAVQQNADVVEFRIKDVTNYFIDISHVEMEKQDFLVELDTEVQRKEFLLRVDEKISLGSQKKLYRLAMLKENNIRFAEHVIFEEPSFIVPVRLYERRHYFLDEELYICFLSPNSSMRGEWGEQKWDNRKVWECLVEDLKSRNMLNRYYAEIEYLFIKWCFGLSLSMWCQKGYIVTIEEFGEIQKLVFRLFPRALQNPYMSEQDDWEKFLTILLNIDITEESMQVVNQMLRKFISVKK